MGFGVFDLHLWSVAEIIKANIVYNQNQLVLLRPWPGHMLD